MNTVIIKNINDKVQENDILYHLGDWSFGGFHSIKEFRDQINCRNIHLILGNHDVHITKNKDNVSSLFSSVSSYKEVVIGGNTIILSHYPMMVWNGHYHGSWMLFGHCHGSLDSKYLGGRKMMDVGIDTHPEFRPYHLDEIRKIMDVRSIEFVDHHDENTRNHKIVE
jgi:calcineurin-like phosphoesterase family protein